MLWAGSGAFLARYRCPDCRGAVIRLSDPLERRPRCRHCGQLLRPASLLPAEKLAALYAEVPPGPVISYCNTGHTAATNWFVLSEVLGRPDVGLYDGSMTDWTQDDKRPVETG